MVDWFLVIQVMCASLYAASGLYLLLAIIDKILFIKGGGK